MNHHSMPAGGQMPAMHSHEPRRPQQFHPHAHAFTSPQSPGMHHPHNPYASYHHQQYYPHPQQLPYPPPPRWTGYHHPAQSQYMPSPQHTMPPQFQPRSPMIVSSTPLTAGMQSGTRPLQMMSAAPSPRPSAPPYIPHAHLHTLAAPPSPAPTPKQEPDAAVLPPQQVPTPTTPQPEASSRRQSQAQLVQNPLAMPPETRMPFYPELPWYSTTEGSAAFPARATPSRRRRQNLLQPTDAVALPARDAADADTDEVVQTTEEQSSETATIIAPQIPTDEELASETSTIAAPSEPETPATSQAPSESDYTNVSTPATPVQPAAPSPKVTPTQHHTRRDTRPAIAVPNLPVLPKAKPSPPAAARGGAPPAQVEESAATPMINNTVAASEEFVTEQPEQPRTLPLKPAVPKSWADLVRTKAAAETPTTQANCGASTNGVSLSKSASLADALKQYNVQNDLTLSFIEPRGLVNTGNMCYMNSILQVLMFCTPFYSFLDQVRQRTVHSIKSDTPLIDAMIMFMREFKVLASADSVNVLRKTLKQEQFEQYGEPVTPEYVYDAIRKLPRFQTMRRGHQQDAEEFLGFLLEGLHDECVEVIRGQPNEKPKEDDLVSPNGIISPTFADGWLEVGPRQKASTTRTAGQEDAPSPVTKIFGGYLRSELRVPGVKDSVTREPYQPLQLDIGAPNVNNIVDALKGLTRTEVLTGDFGGRSSTTAKKQVFIDTLPPVLILHLKRFQYDNNLTGTQKIWKKVGYPLELEIPKEVFPPAKRGGFAVQGGLPRYRLTSVVYHHGKSAAGGHYTVDVLRQDSCEWVRMDDTVIRRVRPEDVAEGGAEENPKLLAKALEQHKADQDLQKQRNTYQGLDEAEKEPEEEKPWSEVNGNVNGKKWSGVGASNGTAPPASAAGKRTPTAGARKDGVKDNKVAYILLYEKIRG